MADHRPHAFKMLPHHRGVQHVMRERGNHVRFAADPEVDRKAAPMTLRIITRV